MRARRGDAGISDITGTLLMVAAVVVGGGLLTATVTDTLSAPRPPVASFSLAPVDVGADRLTVALRQGEDLALSALVVMLERNGASENVPPSQWTTSDPTLLRAGQSIVIPLSPVAASGEKLVVRVASKAPDAILATLAAQPGASAPSLGPATLSASLTPSVLYPDGAAAAQLTVRVSHPAGAGAVARLVADLHALGAASGTANAKVPLNDAGLEGDAVGGDGNWTALIRPAVTTRPGSYAILVNSTDLDGASAGNASVLLTTVSSPNTTITGGNCYGCAAIGGGSSYEGTRLYAPTSNEVKTFRLQNWTWDKLTPANLKEDALVVRIVNASAAWSMYMRFDYVASTPCIIEARIWTASNQTAYLPYNGTCLSIDRLDLDLMDPVGSRQLKPAPTTGPSALPNSVADPLALYRSVNMTGKPVFIVAYLRDEDPTGQEDLSQEIGIFSMDVVIS